ncbi:MAG: alpha/beta hydrolase [Bacteroidales bacterium]|nr:alpha/beta hydrolase [Bacteroidales bacterium]
MIASIKQKKIYYNFFNENTTSQKPIIVFLHEGLGCTEQWRGFPEYLCTKLNMPGLVYDRYGHGKSTELQEDRTINYLHEEAHFLNEFLQEIKIISPVILFGHSDGGTIALLHAAFYPQNVKKVITEAHHVLIEKESVEGVKLAKNAYENGRLKPALEIFHGSKTDSMFYGWANTWINADTSKYFLYDELKKIRCPVLAIQGENDQYGTYKQMQAIADYCTNYELLWLKNCGHIPHADYKEEITQKTSDFLKK